MSTRLAYISTLSNTMEGGSSSYTRELLKIMNQARFFNKSNNITGVLFVSGNYCLQVLEGESKVVAQLMFKISRDTRHHDMDLIYKKKVDKRLFESWSMRLITKETKAYSDGVRNLYKIDTEIKNSILDHSSSKRLKCIISGINFNESTDEDALALNKSIESYDGKVLSIRRWPKGTEFQITSQNARLCTTLSGAGVPYESLCSKAIYNKQDQLIKSLDTLYMVGLLTAKSKTDTLRSQRTYPANSRKSKPDRFSKMLRNFISASGKK